MGGWCGRAVERAVTWSGREILTGVACGALLAGTPALAAGQETTPDRSPTEMASAVHEVRRGDTLWDLAGHYLSNPFQWPVLYQLNTHVVEDPHWIYPGEILSLPDAVAVAPAGLADADRPGDAADPAAGRDADARQDAARRPGTRSGVSGFGGPSVFDRSPDTGNVLGGLDIDAYSTPQLVSRSDFWRAPLLIDREGLPYIGRTVRKLEGNPLDLRIPPGVQLNDRVVIELERLDVVRGDRLRALRWGRSVEGLRVLSSLAILEVTDVGPEAGMARAVVRQLFGDYGIGDLVILAEAFDLPEPLEQAIEQDGQRTTVLGFEVEQPVLGENDMIFLDAGAPEGVNIGDEFALFDREADAGARWEDRLAVVRVVRVTEHSSTARVVDLVDTSPEPGSPARRVLRGIAR